jgi:CMP-N-acetylneuraminic acid synthetase
VTVSTEDPEIAETALRYGAAVARREPGLATDNARIIDVCFDLLARREAEGNCPDVLCVPLATAPMRGAQDIRNVCELVTSGRHEFAMAVTTYDHPPYQALREDGAGNLVPMWPEVVNLRSKDLPQLYVDNGSTYCFSVPAFRAQQTLYGTRLGGYTMPRSRSVDIDDRTDFDLALFWAGREGA